MKIVSFSSGLGNQLFQYGFYVNLSRLFPGERVYGYYGKKSLSKHNGLDIGNAFLLDLPPATAFSNLIATGIRVARRIFGLKRWIVHDSIEYNSGYFFDGWWQDVIFCDIDEMRLVFNVACSSEKNLTCARDISNSESVSVHVRRGDYVTSEFSGIYGGICDVKYYVAALEWISQHYRNPTYYVFSDDIEWAKANLPISDAVFVDWNRGKESYMDMYLMSLCDGAVIANSTFSYWGARLGRKDKLVVYPKTWVNPPHVAPNIFPEVWVGL